MLWANGRPIKMQNAKCQTIPGTVEQASSLPRPLRPCIPCGPSGPFRRAVFLLLLLATAAPASAGPLETVRAFVDADGRGERLRTALWPRVAPLVAWRVEPAWDGAILIRGLEIVPVSEEEDLAQFEVRYTVVGEVRSGVHHVLERIEARRFLVLWQGSASLDSVVRSGGGGDVEGRWRIAGPPPVPHVFESNVAVEQFAASFDPERGTFITAPVFVWRALRASNPKVPYADTAGLLAAPFLEPVDEPRTGDVAVFLDGEQPYHCAVVRDPEVVESATLSGGIRRDSPDAFAGAVRLLRLRKEWQPQAAAVTPAASAAAPEVTARQRNRPRFRYEPGGAGGGPPGRRSRRRLPPRQP